MLRRIITLAILLAIIVAAGPDPSAADSEPIDTGIVSELKLGVSHHDTPILGSHLEDGVDIGGEVLFTSPDFLSFAWSPRPHLGVHVNTAGDTSQAYWGLTWSLEPKGDGVWFAFSLGGSVHDGEIDDDSGEQKSLGTRVLLRESVELGVVFSEHHRFSILFDHVSNAGIGERNQGLDTLGLRYGYRF